jgi:hypothetical protein
VGAVEAIERERVVAVLRRVGDVEAAVERLGLSIVEVTMDSPGALEAIASLRVTVRRSPAGDRRRRRRERGRVPRSRRGRRRRRFESCARRARRG